MAIINIEKLNYSYGKKEVLKELSLDIDENKLTGISVPLGALYTKDNQVIGEFPDLQPFCSDTKAYRKRLQSKSKASLHFSFFLPP